MEVWRVIGSKFFALALILLLSINSNFGEKFNHNERKIQLTEGRIDSAHTASSLFDSNGKLRLANEWQIVRNRRDVPTIMESSQIIPGKAVKSYMGEIKKRDKRFLIFLPALAPLFQALLAGTALTAATVVAQNPITIPRLTWSDYPTYSYETPRRYSTPKTVTSTPKPKSSREPPEPPEPPELPEIHIEIKNRSNDSSTTEIYETKTTPEPPEIVTKIK